MNSLRLSKSLCLSILELISSIAGFSLDYMPLILAWYMHVQHNQWMSSYMEYVGFAGSSHTFKKATSVSFSSQLFLVLVLCEVKRARLWNLVRSTTQYKIINLLWETVAMLIISELGVERLLWPFMKVYLKEKIVDVCEYLYWANIGMPVFMHSCIVRGVPIVLEWTILFIILVHVMGETEWFVTWLDSSLEFDASYELHGRARSSRFLRILAAAHIPRASNAFVPTQDHATSLAASDSRFQGEEESEDDE